MDEQQLQQQIVQLVQAAMQGDPLATLQILSIMQAAQQGDKQATQIAQLILEVAQSMAQYAKFGAKLNYIQYLKGVCPEGSEMQFFKQGGRVCKKCMKKAKMEDGGKTPNNPIDAFRCGRKMKKKACGGTVKEAKCGSKMNKKLKIRKGESGFMVIQSTRGPKANRVYATQDGKPYSYTYTWDGEEPTKEGLYTLSSKSYFSNENGIYLGERVNAHHYGPYYTEYDAPIYYTPELAKVGFKQIFSDIPPIDPALKGIPSIDPTLKGRKIK